VGEAGVERGVAAVVVVELKPEVVANGAEDAEGAVVADGPGSEDGGGGEAGEDEVEEPAMAGFACAPCERQAAMKARKGQRGQRGGVGERGEAGERAPADPGEGLAVRWMRWAMQKLVVKSRPVSEYSQTRPAEK
jgi:hypothetical protein